MPLYRGIDGTDKHTGIPRFRLLTVQYTGIPWYNASPTYWHTATVNCLAQWCYAASASVCTCMGKRISMSISVDSLSDETLNRGPWRCCYGDSMYFPLGLK